MKIGTFLTGASLICKCIYSVEPGENAIVFSKIGGGIQNKVYTPGYHFYIPFLQEIIRYDIRI